MKKFIKILVCVIIATGIVFSAFTAYEYANLIDETEIQTYNTEKSSFKVAVISDTQLAPTEEELKTGGEKKDSQDYKVHLQNFKNALNVGKNNDVDMILFPGDIGDLGTRYAFQTYVDTIDEVFGDDKPIIQTIMGNHDYWNKNVFTGHTKSKISRTAFLTCFTTMFGVRISRSGMRTMQSSHLR